MKSLYRRKTMRVVAGAMLSLLFVGCNIDDSYDLSKAADDTTFGVGTDDTSFDLPLLEVKIKASQIFSETTEPDDQASVVKSSSDESSSAGVEYMMGIVEEITAFMPSTLEGDYSGGIDISQLSDEEYASGLVEQLFDELSTNETSRVEFVELIMEKEAEGDEDYAAQIAALEVALGQEISSYDSAESCAADLEKVLSSTDAGVMSEIEDIKSEVTTLIVGKTEDLKTLYTINETINETIDIGEDIIEILEKNLDGDKNTLSLLFTSESNLPFSVTITPVIELSSGVVITIAEFKESITSGATSLTSEQFRELLSGMTFKIDVEINNYDPSTGDLDLTDKYILMKLIARKSGSLIF